MVRQSLSGAAGRRLKGGTADADVRLDTSRHLGAIDLSNFVIPFWYLIAIALAAGAYYGALRHSDRIEEEKN